MKALPATLAAIAIAVVAGFTGYQIGRSSGGTPVAEQSADLPPASTSRQVTRSTSGFRKSDIPAFRARLAQEANPLRRFQDALEYMEDWVSADPEDALAWLMEQPRSERRDEVIRLAIGQFAESDPKAAAIWAHGNLTGDALNNSLILITEEWALRNGAEAADWLNTLPPSHERDAALEGTFFVWAANHPEAAVSHLASHPPEDELATILRYATYAGWAKSNPENAVRASLESSRRHGDPNQFASTLANWATIDLPASSDWLLENLPVGPERSASVLELAGMYASLSPQAGVTWLDRLESGSEREAAANKLASEWAATDPVEAAKWSAAQTVAPLDGDTVSEIVHCLLMEDDEAFETWRSGLSPGPLKTAADELAATMDSPDEDEDE